MDNKYQPDVVVVGAGYVGLTLSLHLASRRLKVLAVDINEEAIKSLQNGESTIFEDSIVVALKDCIKSGNLKFSTTPPSNGCSYWIIAISYFPGDKSHYLRVLDIIKSVFKLLTIMPKITGTVTTKNILAAMLSMEISLVISKPRKLAEL